jgi:hypothetical protein
MVTEVDDTFMILLLEALRGCAAATGMNSLARYMLAQEVAGLGKEIADLTLGELQAALVRVDLRYDAVANLIGKSSGDPVTRVVMAKGLSIEGRWYSGPELAGLLGKKVTIELWPGNSLTLVASHDGDCFRLYSAEEVSSVRDL